MNTRTMKEQILEELRRDQRIDAARISVAVSEAEGVILTGCVHSYPARCWSEEVAGRVAGGIPVRNDLEVRLTIGEYRTDETLQRILSEILEALATMSETRPEATVHAGWLTLQGQVRWPFQKRLAEQAVTPIAGIRGITNQIDVIQA